MLKLNHHALVTTLQFPSYVMSCHVMCLPIKWFDSMKTFKVQGTEQEILVVDVGMCIIIMLEG